jgi:hypothetical protein
LLPSKPIKKLEICLLHAQASTGLGKTLSITPLGNPANIFKANMTKHQISPTVTVNRNRRAIFTISRQNKLLQPPKNDRCNTDATICFGGNWNFDRSKPVTVSVVCVCTSIALSTK